MKQFNEHHTFNGMQRDIDIPLHPANILYDAHNIRLTAREDDTLLAITNERGTKDLGSIVCDGTYLGHCLLNNYLVVFTTSDNYDNIYRIDLSNAGPEIVTLYQGKKAKDKAEDKSLSFSTKYPIETIGSYENGSVQKVYWTDNYNQPRVINIVPTINIDPDDPSHSNDPLYSDNNPNRFDFIPVLELNETVKVKKILAGNGVFAPGVIQYAFTYYYKYGQESNIFHTTPLMYISYKDKGGSPEDKVDNAFSITVENLDQKFDYLRIYSIQRTSINGTPYCKRVQDIYIKDLADPQTHIATASFIDNGTMGDTVDPTELLYKGGEELKVKTLEQKDNTLFFGNLELTRESINDIKKKIQDNFEISDNLVSSDKVYNFKFDLTSTTDYVYGSQLSATDADGYAIPCSGFKGGETYRLGIQFQHKSGKWSEPIHIGDHPVGDKDNWLHFSFSKNGSTGNMTVPCFIGKIGKDLSETIIGKGYVKARALYVMPTANDRDIICQGVLNPTVVKGSLDITTVQTSPEFIQSSWFFRPLISDESNIDSESMMVSPEHNGINDAATETTTEYFLPYTYIGKQREGDPDRFLGYNPDKIRAVEIQGEYNNENKFQIDKAYSTLHSPDFEFDEQYQLMQFSELNYNIVGHASFLKTFSDIDIQTETPAVSGSGSGFIHKRVVTRKSFGIVSGLFYDDFFADDENPEDTEPKIRAYPNERASAKWLVYPWQSNGSLNNDINRPSYAGVQSALLKKKVISNLRFADSIWNDKKGDSYPTTPVIYSTSEGEVVKIENYFYTGNVDTMLSPDNSDGSYCAFEGCEERTDTLEERTYTYWVETDTPTPFTSTKWMKTFSADPNSNVHNGRFLYEGDTQEGNDVWHRMDFLGATGNLGDAYVDLVRKKGGVRMKYKSTPHLIMSNYTDIYNDAKPSQTASDYSDYSVLPIIELKKTDTHVKYGGNNPDALRANVWIPCGEAVKLGDETDGSTELKWTYGDTYYQRWDCLKTYPFTREDPNQIVEIGSFMLETHVNIDGRYDRNRGQLSNINMSPQNFNLFNPVYSQPDNFFSYRILDDDYYKNIHFPNQITWSKEKHAGADTDIWTNVTLASTYDMDGAKGEVISLNTWRDNIYCFQKKGVSNILFNSRVQIPTSDNVPIEITNSYKVDGYRYLSDGVGCKDGRQVKETPAGIYFIDNVTNHLFQIGDGMADLTQTKNMSSWFKYLDNANSGLTRLMYDEANKDLYLVDNKTALCYSEVLGQFTSFMDYGGVSLIESYDQNVFTMKKDGDSEKLWQMFKGYYNFFFNEYKPWSVTFVSNGNANQHQDMDKVFTNIDYRMDMIGNSGYAHDNSLDYMRVWNEYQDTENVDLSLIKSSDGKFNIPNSILQKKFRTWRIQIPRSKGSVDRIRNTWCKIELGCNKSNSRKAILHDLNVQYYI